MSLIETMQSIGSQLPFWAVATALAILSAIWGSFAAALCHRWPKGESIMRGRSHCDHCGRTLGAHELVPLISYIIQRGKCISCSTPISLSNPLTELACVLLGLIAALCFDGYAAFAATLFFWLLVPLIILDWQHLWLPDALIAALAVCGLFLGEYVSTVALNDRLTAGVAGFAALQAIRLGYRRLRGVEGMGGGDPKLMGAIGLWTGWQALPIIVMLASAIGLFWFLAQAAPKSGEKLKAPLGSFLAVAAMLFFVGSQWGQFGVG